MTAGGRLGRRLPSLAIAGLAFWLAGTAPAMAGDVLEWANSLIAGCWSCDILGTIISIGLRFAGQAFDTLAGPTATLLGLLMALWILFFAAGLFLPFGPEGGVGALWNKGAKRLFQFALVLACLQSGQAVWGYVFIPVMSAGMGFSKAVVTLTDPYETGNGTSETGPGGGSPAAACRDSGTVPGDNPDGAIAIMAQMNCPLATIQSQFGKGMLIGVAQVQGAPRGNDWAMMICVIISGLVLIAVYFFGLVMFPIFLLDVVMRLVIVTALSPVALAAWLFEPTRRLAHKALWQVAHAALTLVFVSIIGGLGKASLAYVFSHLSLNGVPARVEDWSALIRMLEDQHTRDGTPFYIDLTTMAFYQLLGIGVILIYMLRQAGHMASEFTGSGSGDFSGIRDGVAALAGGAVSLGGYALGRLAGGGGRSDGGGTGSGGSGGGRGGGAGETETPSGRGGSPAGERAARVAGNSSADGRGR